MFEVAQRIEKGGMKNQHISQAYVHAKTAWRNESERENGKQYGEIVSQFNRANHQLNDFINYRNKQFQPMVSDVEIKKRIQEPIDSLIKCRERLFEFEKSLSNVNNKSNVNNLKEAIAKRLEKSEEYLQFVNSYLSKPISVRRTMFYTTVVRKRVNSK